ncbi:MAG: DNA topoisomerase 4 subunit A [Oscillatoriales cyanobacterium]|nr:MAG: DNA topoisomerase 4 subunit A [Oscillatoriales cyanobacterium]
MSSQLDLLSNNQVIPTALHEEMQRCYLEYAMSVIVGRALPDVRDGLKPVHRRIIYAMHELGLTPDRPYRKCARVVGDVLGKYHPHGDQAVYDALVRLVQDFSSRYPLLAGHGNFGSIDNDPAAAMRYTETRLSAIGHGAMLGEIGDATVDFTGNFDNSQQEPVVLPAQLPMLLLNGSSGIAVGMATNIPPHNLGEVVDGAIALLDKPTITDDKLLEIIPGPDFPTGGEIVGRQGIRDAYLTGRGSITMRGVVHFENIEVGRKRKSTRSAIVVTEFPYQVTKSNWIEKLANLVNEGKIIGISDLRDESDRDGVRVVIELKRDANRSKILAQIYKHTQLQQNFGAIFLALVDRQPVELSLRAILQHFLDFRTETLTRQYRHELDRVESRLHLLDGLQRMLARLDEAIAILRNAPDGGTAKQQFYAEFDFSEAQANAVLAMPMRRLTGLEQQNLRDEIADLTQERDRLQLLLDSESEFKKALKKELRSLKKQFGDPRRTRIITVDGEVATDNRPTPSKDSTHKVTPEPAMPLELEIQAEDAAIEVTYRGYVRRLTPKAASRQHNADIPDVLDSSDDLPIARFSTRTDRQLISVCRDGKVYATEVGNLPVTSGRGRGDAAVSLLPPSAQGDPDAVVSQFILDDLNDPAVAQHLLIVTASGKLKRVELAELTSMTARGLTVIKLKEDDHVLLAQPVVAGTVLILASTGGRLLRLTIDDQRVPVLGRTAQGHQGLRLRKTEWLAGATVATARETIAIISQSGFVKPLAVESLKLGDRGAIGVQAVQFKTKTDGLIGVVTVRDTDYLIATLSDTTTRTFAMAAIAQLGSAHAGQKLPGLTGRVQLTEVVAAVLG